MKKVKSNFIITGILFIISIAFILAVKTIDVFPIGPQGSEVGFAKLNSLFHDLFGQNKFFYKLTDLLGKFSILVMFFFACVGLYQLITRKSIKKVDVSILVLAGFYILVALTYVFFEIVIVNYRPVIIDNKLEASFPSSHTMLVICVMSTAIMLFNSLIKNENLRNIADITAVIIMIVAVIGRIISGVHWITDIIGGILISFTLVMLYYSIVKYICCKKKHAQ